MFTQINNIKKKSSLVILLIFCFNIFFNIEARADIYTNCTSEAFFETPKVKSREKIAKFMNAVQGEALVPGDFYHFKGRAVAVIGIIKKAERVINSHSSQMNIAI